MSNLPPPPPPPPSPPFPCHLSSPDCSPTLALVLKIYLVHVSTNAVPHLLPAPHRVHTLLHPPRVTPTSTVYPTYLPFARGATAVRPRHRTPPSAPTSHGTGHTPYSTPTPSPFYLAYTLPRTNGAAACQHIRLGGRGAAVPHVCAVIHATTCSSCTVHTLLYYTVLYAGKARWHLIAAH